VRAERLTAILFAAALLSPWPALAQATVNDAGVITDMPDASAGEGGAQTGGNPEGQDDNSRVVARCRYTSDCNGGFGCQDGRCVWNGYRYASGGCLCDLSSVTALLLGAVVLAARRGRRKGPRGDR